MDRLMVAVELPGIDTDVWRVRRISDWDACDLADRHYTRRVKGARTVGPPGRRLVLVTPDGLACWITHYSYFADDGLDAFRCTMFRNEGPQLASALIREAMRVTLDRMPERPADGWLTYIEPRRLRSSNPGYCFKRAGWWRDRDYRPGYRQRHLIRLRAGL